MLRMNLRAWCGLNCLILLGLIFLSFAAVLSLVLPGIIQSRITEQTRLVNGSETFSKWQAPTFPIYLRIVIFNVTNARAVLRGERPVFNEVGPIVYEEKRLKEIERIDLERDTVTYRQSITYFHRPDLSTLGQDDLVTFLNMPLAGVSKLGLADGLGVGAMRDIVHDYMDDISDPAQVSPFLTKRVRELLFDGYHDGLIQMLSGLKQEEILPNNTVGIYYGKNGTLGPLYEVYAGVKDFREFGEILRKDGEEMLNTWEDPYCNQLNGSDGSIFPPFVTQDRVLRVFSEDSCRSIYMSFQKEVDYFGVNALRFHLPPGIWASVPENPDNQCFAPTHPNRSGLMDLSLCRKGAPVFASAPHFLYGEARDWDPIGVKPNLERDETYLDLEPNTGMLMGAMKRFQVNVELFRNKRVRGFAKVPRMMFPVLWGEEVFSVPEERAEMIREKLVRPLRVLALLEWTTLGLGLIFILSRLAIFILQKSWSSSRNSSPHPRLELANK